AARPLSASGLVPGDRHVHEPLEEVAFRSIRRAPCRLELLVGAEVVAFPDQVEASFEGVGHAPRSYQRCLAVLRSALWRRSFWRGSTCSFAASSKRSCRAIIS